MSRSLFLIFHGRYPSEKAAALFALESASAFVAQGYTVTVLAPRRLGRDPRTNGAVYLPTVDLFALLPQALAFRISFVAFSLSSYIYLLLRAKRVDIIYSNESLPLFFASLSFPHTLYELHDYPEYNHSFYQSLFRRVQGLVVTNELKAKRLRSDYPRIKDKILVEMNAVSLTKFSTELSRSDARNSLNLSEDKKIVVYTGHLYAWKGVDTLGESAKLLGDDVLVYVVGGTDEDIVHYKTKWGGVANLRIIGHRPHDEMPLWQKAADVLVLPNTAKERISTEDTSPMKLFEYMASGTPIVASRLPSIQEVVGGEAVFVTPDDASSLAHGILSSLESPASATRSGAARTRVAEHTWEARAKRIGTWIGSLPSRHEQFRHERILFCASLFMSLIFLSCFVFTHGFSAPFSKIGSDGYLPLAVALYEHGTFTLSTTTPYILEGAHVPGYPLFLSITAAPWGLVTVALILQALLFAFATILLYRLFDGVFSPRVRFWGALIFAVEPYTAFTIVQPLSEALFMTIFIGSLVIFRRAYENARPRLFFIGSLLLSASVLVRPIALYLVPLITMALGILVWFRSARESFRVLLLMILGTLLVLTPWAYRNHEAFGVWSLSTKGPYSFYFYDAALVLQYRGLGTATEVTEALVKRAQAVFPEIRNQDDLRSPQYSDFFMKESLDIIKESPSLFFKMYAVSLGTYFLSDGYRLLWYEISEGAITLPNITKAIVTGDFFTLAHYFKTETTQAVLFVLGFFFWASTFILVGVGGVAGLWSNSPRIRWVVLAVLFIVAYFALLTGPLAQARYRIVATPFLFMLASYGVAVVTYLYAHRRIA